MTVLLRRLSTYLDSRPLVGLLAVSILYFAVCSYTASRRMLDIDELFNLQEVSVPQGADLWRAMQTGAEKLPPSFVWLNRGVTQLLGISPFTLRLPAIAGFWGMCVCLYAIAAPRSTPVFGLIAMTFPLVIPPFFYATEARSYGLMLGFCGLGALSWLALESRRRLALAGLALSMVGVTASHYYGVLLVVPLAAAELFRSYRNRRADFAAWLCFGLVLVPIAAFLPLVRQMRMYAGSFWSKPQISDLVKLPEPVIGQVAAPLLAIVAALAIWRPQSPTAPSTRVSTLGEDPNLFVLLCALFATPVVGWVVAKFVTGAYTARYALEPVIALSVFFALGLYRATGRSAVRGLAALAVLLLFTGIGFARAATKWPSEMASVEAIPRLSQAFDRHGLPVVISSIEMWLRLNYYDSACERSHCVYLDDAAESLRYTGENTNEREILEFRSIMPRSLQVYQSWISGRREFLLYAVTDRSMWILPKLIADRWNVQLAAYAPNGMLLYISRPDPPVQTTGLPPQGLRP